MKDKHLLINLKTDRCIINILGEVCWGFKIENFEKIIGAKFEVVEELLERLIKQEKKGETDVYLNALDVEIVKKAFVEVKKEIEEWEFQTRIGISIKEANEIKDRLNHNEKEKLLSLDSEIKNEAEELGNDWLMCPLCQEAWEEHSTECMLCCPKCNNKLDNPRFKS